VSVPEPPRPPLPPEPRTAVLGEPPGAPQGPWWQRDWGVAAIAVLGLIIGAGIGAAIGASGKGTTKTVTNEGTTATVEAAQTSARTVTHFVVHTHTVTHTVTAAPAAPSEESSGGSTGNSYSGSGTKSLGTITVAQNSTIHWKAGGGFFSINNAPEDSQTINLTSQASSGEGAIEAGTYHKVTIAGVGEWSFTIDPG
jgi:hypothetical protein